MTESKVKYEKGGSFKEFEMLENILEQDMLSQKETGKLMHDLKRMAKALKLLNKMIEKLPISDDVENCKTLLSLLSDNADDMATDIQEMTERQ